MAASMLSYSAGMLRSSNTFAFCAGGQRFEGGVPSPAEMGEQVARESAARGGAAVWAAEGLEAWGAAEGCSEGAPQRVGSTEAQRCAHGVAVHFGGPSEGQGREA